MTAQRTNPATRAGHSVIRLPRSVAGMRGVNDDNRLLRDPDMAVYVAMVDLADNASHMLRVETARIAARAGVHVATVRRTLKSRLLQDLGLIRDTVEASQVEVVAPSVGYEGGFLSVPRAALWSSPEAALGMPVYALQSLLVLIATSDWGGDGSTSLRSSRFRQTMAGDLIDMRRFERGLQYLDALPWVHVEAQPYSAAMAQWGMARRMPTVRILDWAALPAYKPRAVETVVEALQAPVARVIAPRAPIVASASAVPAQGRTEPVVPVETGSGMTTLSVSSDDVNRLFQQVTGNGGGDVGAAVKAAYSYAAEGATAARDVLHERLNDLLFERRLGAEDVLSHLMQQAKILRDNGDAVDALSDVESTRQWLLTTGLPSTVGVTEDWDAEEATERPLVSAEEVAARLIDMLDAHADFRQAMPTNKLVNRAVILMARGWHGNDLVTFARNRRARTKSVENKRAWLLGVALPSVDDAVGDVAPLTLREQHPGARDETTAVMRAERQRLAESVSRDVNDEEAPF